MWYEGKVTELLENLPDYEFNVEFLFDGNNFFVWVNEDDSTVDFIKSSRGEHVKYVVITSAGGKTLAFVTKHIAKMLCNIVPCISPSSVNPFANYDPEIAKTDFQMLCRDGTVRNVIKLDGVLYLHSENTEMEPFKTSNQIIRMAIETQRYYYQKQWYGPHFPQLSKLIVR